jgi:hypothetical protein
MAARWSRLAELAQQKEADGPTLPLQYYAAITETARRRQLRLLFGFGDCAKEYSLPRSLQRATIAVPWILKKG